MTAKSKQIIRIFHERVSGAIVSTRSVTRKPISTFQIQKVPLLISNFPTILMEMCPNFIIS